MEDQNIESGKDNEDIEKPILIEGKEINYKSGEIAEQLGISRDMVRYYSNEFSEFLNITKTKEGKGGHGRYSIEDLEMLQMIVALHNQKKTGPEIKALLKVPGVNVLFNSSNDNEKAFAALLAQNNQYVIEGIGRLLVAQQSKFLEDKEQTNIENKLDRDNLSSDIKELRVLFNEQTELIKDLLSKEEQKANKKGFMRLFNKK